jgi:hypothetical protein
MGGERAKGGKRGRALAYFILALLYIRFPFFIKNCFSLPLYVSGLLP